MSLVLTIQLAKLFKETNAISTKFDMIAAFPISIHSTLMQLIQQINLNFSQCLQLLPVLGLPDEGVHYEVCDEWMNN